MWIRCKIKKPIQKPCAGKKREIRVEFLWVPFSFLFEQECHDGDNGGSTAHAIKWVAHHEEIFKYESVADLKIYFQC